MPQHGRIAGDRTVDRHDDSAIGDFDDNPSHTFTYL
jgi:hypothetical protein